MSLNAVSIHTWIEIEYSNQYAEYKKNNVLKAQIQINHSAIFHQANIN